MQKLKNQEHQSLLKSHKKKLMFSEMQNFHSCGFLRFFRPKNLFFQTPEDACFMPIFFIFCA